MTLKVAPTMATEKIMVVNISGRGDKDLFITARALDHDRWLEFLGREVKREE
jgi:tryptophan synthase beta chain